MMILPELSALEASAPSSGVLASARKLASARHWLATHQQAGLLWGSVQGSTVYHVALFEGLLTPRCTCPSFKKPCKHGLALLLYAHAQPEAFATAAASLPEPVQGWLDKQQAQQQKKSAAVAPLAEAVSASPDGTEARRTAEKQKRSAARQARMADGVALVLQVLDDVATQGLAVVRQHPQALDELPARLLDAQCSGLAELAGQLRQSLFVPDWQQQAPRVLAELFLLATLGQQALATASPEPTALVQEVRLRLGWPLSSKDLAETQPLQQGLLTVVGVQQGSPALNPRLTWQRVWYWDAARQQAFFTLDFGGMGPVQLPPAPRLGQALQASYWVYPGRGQRIQLQDQQGQATVGVLQPQFDRLEQALSAQAASQESWPLLWPQLWSVGPVQLQGEGECLWAVDGQGDALPVQAPTHDLQTLLMASVGRPVTVWGCWQHGEWTLLALQRPADEQYPAGLWV